MDTNLHESFIQLVRLGIGHTDSTEITDDVDWENVKVLAEQQGLSAVVLDGIEKASQDCQMPLELKLQWIGEVLQEYESRYKAYEKAIGEMAGFYSQHGYKMMVLKGYACSLDWPRPKHRPCGDIDIWLFGLQKEADEALLKANTNHTDGTNHFAIDASKHHHTTFYWGDFMVENHYDFINTHRHYSHRGLEQMFKELGQDDSHFVELKGASAGSAIKVYLPSPNLHALFLIRHALNHFASIGINLRQVLDWAFFAEKHTNEIDWQWLTGVLEKFHMLDFYNCMNAICVEKLGFAVNIFHGVQFNPSLKDKVFEDIMNPAFGAEEPKSLVPRLIYKIRRWKRNAWKQEMCYDESRSSAFWSGVWNHLLKPASI